MSFGDADSNKVAAHYTRRNLKAAILAALLAAGRDPGRLKPQDIAPLDEFHIRGREATLELARKIGIDDRVAVLDVGSGLGGPSRCLASEFGCRVTGLDLTGEYCRVATMLARLLGLDSRVSYHQGNALHMPFEDAAFDVVWTQHAAMNIHDKSQLYGEMWRVLKPGGILAIYDIVAGTGGPVRFPVPWAREPSISFLVSSEQMRTSLEETGFRVSSWLDATESGRVWFRRIGDKMRAEGPPPLGLHLLMGSDYRLMLQNQVLNLEEGRIGLIEVIARRPGMVG